MSLWSRDPDSIEWHGKRIRLNLSYDRVLYCYKVMDDSTLTEYDVAEICLHILCRGRHTVDTALLSAIFALLSDGQKDESGKKSIDFEQDSELIYAAFMQTYGIDLKKTKLHWKRFISLLSSIPSGTRLMEIIDIRTRPMPKPTQHNGEERANLMRLKNKFAIKLSEEEKKRNYEDGLKRLADTLIGMANSKGE